MSQDDTSLSPASQQLPPTGQVFVGDSGTGLPQGYLPPKRLLVNQPGLLPRYVQALTVEGKAGLLAPDGSVRDFYDRTREARTEFAKLDDITRRNVKITLYKKGWYGSSKPELGDRISDADKAAMSDLLETANVEGYTWDVLLRQIEKAPDVEFLGTGGRDKPSSADLTDILQKTSLQTIGKKLDDKTVNQLVSSYQGVYTANTQETPPSADVFFQDRIEQQYGADTTAYKYLNAISNVSKVIESL